MSYTLFISDVHLCHTKPKTIRAFFKFLKKAIYADSLYILGDLFEFWMGDDDHKDLHKDVASALLKIKYMGIPCFFIHGNRDFLIGQHFIEHSGITVLPQEIVIKLYGKKILILHGDTLCTNDLKYQFFRYFSHKLWIKNFFLSLPLFFRKLIVSCVRIDSKKYNYYNISKNSIIDVNQKTVINFIKKHQISFIIHGHTHRLFVQNFNILKFNTKRIVLGNWEKQGSMVKISPKTIKLTVFPL